VDGDFTFKPLKFINDLRELINILFSSIKATFILKPVSMVIETETAINNITINSF